ncbi:dihydroorotase [Bartonella tamiae]|uniref:Dihydroorotase, multifunctional complex type n=1 Tax=Bartonella tamiae Th239 TaxID=1094558 RepID=J0R4P6_9HYPH|nr:dihydroorotase [Bartonella tamiae]EJF90639.1 dihydroorotase, multifunctional complex type [Bartonella tamiae Th239]EJF93984.1 dihydroorotase, multifunctional complex type [Bartonella tamiae Th307]
MTQLFHTIFKGANVVNHDGTGLRDIGVKNGHITFIGDLSAHKADEVIDCTGLHILPGIIDTQVHFREPGADHKENLETGSRAAVLGGVTAVFEMPNTNPLTTSEEALAGKVQRGYHRMHCDFAFWVGGTRENATIVGELERLPGAAGIKVFMGSSTGNLLVDDDESITAILKNTRRRAAFHSEDEERLNERKYLREEDNPASHPVWRDEIAALKSTKRLVNIAHETGARIHILHISTAEEIDFLQHHKDVATLEATHHHLTLSADDYAHLGTFLQMNPPIREKRHRDRIWYGVEQGIIDVLGSDHAPHTREEKEKSYPNSPSGMTGVQTTVAIMLDHVNKGRLSLSRFVDLTSHGPNRIFGLSRKGRIAVGYDADLTIVDLKREETILNAQAGSRAGWTPYHEKRVKGWPVGTIIRGHKVMWEGDIVTPSIGETVSFLEALPKT